MIELSDLIIVFILCTMAWFWWNTQAIKLLARQSAKRHCKSMNLQMLDESVVDCGFRLNMNKRHGLRISRSYKFEFTSTGDERYKGLITLLGNHVVNIELEPHRVPDPDVVYENKCC